MHLLTILNRLQRKESMYYGKNWSTEHCKGNKTVPKTVAATRTEKGH
jgi:hypothetical protein